MAEELHLTKEDLQRMRDVDIMSVDKDSLVDVSEVKIDGSLLKEERVKDYIRQIGNPYCYMDHGVVVKISFSGKGSFDEILTKYLSLGKENM